MSFFRHPIGLYILFIVELWERFGFYCMLAIFKLYMADKDNGEPFLQENSNQIYGLYLAGTYFTPFFGGLLAEKGLGYRLSIILGAIFMGGGYFVLGVPQLLFFFFGLSLIIIGNGLFKPNISSMVGKLYPQGDPRVDSAFTIFYMGINVGAFVSPIVAGYLHSRYGYHTAFMAAGAGMILSMFLFIVGQFWVVDAGSKPKAGAAPTPAVPGHVQGHRNLALILFFLINILFWMAFKQNGNTFALWAKEHTDRAPSETFIKIVSAIGMKNVFVGADGLYPPALQASINPFYVIVFSPLLVLVWQLLRSAKKEPATPAKLVLGFALLALTFCFMGGAGLAGGDTGMMPPSILLGGYAMLTLSELCLSPMGLSLVSKLANPKTRAIWMGLFFVSTAAGGYLAGAIGGLWKIWPHSRFFFFVALTSLIGMGLMIGVYRIIARAMPAKQ